MRKKTFKKIIIVLIILSISAILFTTLINIYNTKKIKEKTIQDTRKLFEYINANNIFEFNMSFYKNRQNENSIREKYKEEFKYSECEAIGYTEYISKEDYMGEYFSKIKLEQLEISNVTDESISIYITVKKPDYKKYIKKALDEEISSGIIFTEQFKKYINSSDVENITVSRTITYTKQDGSWYPVYDDNFQYIIF